MKTIGRNSISLATRRYFTPWIVRIILIVIGTILFLISPAPFSKILTTISIVVGLIWTLIPPSSFRSRRRKLGQLTVIAKKNLRGKSVILYSGFSPNMKIHSASNIIESKINGQPIFSASFSSLPIGNYTALIEETTYLSRTTINANELSKIDWQ